MTLEAISVRAVQSIRFWKYVKIKFLELSKVKAAKGPFSTSCDIENFKS